MNNNQNLEKKLFSYLKNQFKKNDYIKINKTFVPKMSSNRVNRFFSENSIWFSRLKLTETKTIYYFGIYHNKINNNETITPKVLLKYDASSISSIRFSKNEVYILIKVSKKSEEYSQLLKLFSLKYLNKKNDLYYLKLGELNSENLINNIELLLMNFTFELNLDKKYLHIIGCDISELKPSNISKKKLSDEYLDKKLIMPTYSNNLNNLVFNLNSFNLKRIIKNKNLKDSDEKKLNDYIFNKTINDDYEFSTNIKEKNFDDDVFNRISESILNNDSDNINTIINNLNHDLKARNTEPGNNKSIYIHLKTNPVEYIEITNKNILPETSDKHDDLNGLKTIPKENIPITKTKQEKNNIKNIRDLEKRLFKYDENDLKNILVRYRDSIKELKDLNNSQLCEEIKNLDYNTIVKLLINNLNTEIINHEISKLRKYKVKTIVKESFPLEKPRKLQLETISKIYDAIENGYKYIILEAVSGFGKSLIASTLSNIYSDEKSYILTTTNQLINQYFDVFGDNEIRQIKTRSQFSCSNNNGKCSENNCRYSNCGYYNDFIKDFNKSSNCNYLNNVQEGQKSNTTICTYDYFLRENFYHSKNLKPRKLIICDEGHNIDDKIANATRLIIDEKQFRNELKLEMSKEYSYVLQNDDYYYYLLKFKKKYEQIKNNNVKYKKKYEDINKFMSYFNKSNTNLTLEVENKNVYGRTFKEWIFKPITVKNIIKDSLLNYGDVCIFMSSSIFDHENFAYDLDIDKSEIYTLKIPNIFDLSNNPIKIYDNFNLNESNIEKGILEETIPIIKEILKNHKNEKGIIHVNNYEQVKFFYEKHIDSRIIRHYPNDREIKLEKFKNSNKPLVLLSPSMNEGVDLPGDLCRFQIILKLPYLPANNPRINKRKMTYEDGDEWYRYKMLTRLIQSYGRGIRFEGDYCKTYILDNRLWDIIYDDLEGSEIIPKYFIDAIENWDK